MKKWLKRILKWMGLLLLIHIAGVLGWRLLYGRGWGAAPHVEPLDISYGFAAADGQITHEEVAAHYAPQIDQAVNVLLSAGGRGDFITAVDYDGDWSCLNNWENLRRGNLGAVVYYSVQETDTHYYVGYYFYHPRDDAEIWLDMHENDLEGMMLAIPMSEEGFLPPEYMYTQGHGNVYFYTAHALESVNMLHGSHHGGTLTLAEGTGRPHIYITPNGTLNNCGHSVEAAGGHSAYWSVGNSGVRYVYGGSAQTPTSWNGAFADNPCSYELRPLSELWTFRSGPYDGTGVFGSYGAFDGDNWGEDRANPPWAWRNKTAYGFGGSFLSDPAWTINHAIGGAALSSAYTDNTFAEWKISVTGAVIPGGASGCTLHVICDGWEFSDPSWFTLTETTPGVYAVAMGETGREAVWAAVHAGARWHAEVRDAQGRVVPGSAVSLTAEYIGE